VVVKCQVDTSLTWILPRSKRVICNTCSTNQQQRPFVSVISSVTRAKPLVTACEHIPGKFKLTVHRVKIVRAHRVLAACVAHSSQWIKMIPLLLAIHSYVAVEVRMQLRGACMPPFFCLSKLTGYCILPSVPAFRAPSISILSSLKTQVIHFLSTFLSFSSPVASSFYPW
jgi:hypothetical protein